MLKSQESNPGPLGSRRLRKPWNASFGSCLLQALFGLGLGFSICQSRANCNLLVLKIQHYKFLVYYASKSIWAFHNLHDSNFNIVILFSANRFHHFHLYAQFLYYCFPIDAGKYYLAIESQNFYFAWRRCCYRGLVSVMASWHMAPNLNWGPCSALLSDRMQASSGLPRACPSGRHHQIALISQKLYRLSFWTTWPIYLYFPGVFKPTVAPHLAHLNPSDPENLGTDSKISHPWIHHSKRCADFQLPCFCSDFHER